MPSEWVHVDSLCPGCGGDCCESCSGFGTREAYLDTLYAAEQAVQEEIRRQRAESLVWRAKERAKKVDGELGECLRGDLAEALELLGGE